jgi:DNA-binding transcriptional LysR family regulator
MDLEGLRAFVETVRRGSFSAAAEALSLSQPAVSRRISRLEAEVGQRLLERLRPVATPTRAGLAVFTFAQRTLQEWDRLLPSLPAEEHLAGTLHIAASSVPAEVVLPPLVAEFCREHLSVETHLHVMNSETVEECVRRHHCDLGFLGRPPHSPLLHQVPIAQDEVVLAVPATHRLAVQAEVDISDLAGEAFVLREAGSGTWDAVLAALAAVGKALPPRRAAAEVTGAQAHLAAIAAGQGVGFVSLRVAERASGGDPPALALLRLRELRIMRAIHMVFDPRRLSRLAHAFAEFVREHARR